MVASVGAPVSAVLQLDPSVTLAQVSEALTDWLSDTHGVALEPATHGDLAVEWRTSDEDGFVCKLVVSDSIYGK